MKSVLKVIGGFICGLIKFSRSIIFISFVFVLGVFSLAILLPENVQKALEIFTHLIGGWK